MKKLLILILIFDTMIAFSQQAEKSSISAVAFIRGEGVMLRWSPSDAETWLAGNKTGYSLYRFTVSRNSKVLNNPDSIFLGVFLPKPLSEWKTFQDSTYYSVAAEAIYGTGFEVTVTSHGIFDAVNRSREQDSRFSIGLLCADREFRIAGMMGLAYEDKKTAKNEAYLYKVILNSKDTTINCQPGLVLADPGTGNFLPAPFGINHSVNEDIVTILIPYKPFRGIYNSFVLERADGRGSFRIVRDESYYSLSESGTDPEYNTYVDTVVSGPDLVKYRIKGRTPFDSYGPYSDTITVIHRPSLSGIPVITGIKEISAGHITIDWNMPDEDAANVKGYLVSYSDSHKGPYREYQDSRSGPGARQVGIKAPGSFAYFRVEAIDSYDRLYASFPTLYQAIDSIPPAPPTGLAGTFDTTGVATLNWHRGPEEDLLGYKLMYSATDGSEYAIIGNDFVLDTVYSAPFPVEVMSSSLYFRVVAFDLKYNASGPSEAIKLVKPDNLPPAAPFLTLSTDPDGAAIVGIAISASIDVSKYNLVFMGEDGTAKSLFEGMIRRDTTIKLPEQSSGTIYCTAEDISSRKGTSNRIRYTPRAGGSVADVKVTPRVDFQNGLIEVTWSKENFTGNILVYRKSPETGYKLVSTIDSQVGSYIDKAVIYGTEYNYRLIGFAPEGRSVVKEMTLVYR